MSEGSASGSEDRDDTWASESLPMSLRRELLERELKKLGFRRAEAGASAHAGGAMQLQQQPQGSSSSHPQADGDGGEHSN